MPEAARYLGVPVSTFRSWVHGYERRRQGRRPVRGVFIVTTLPRDAGVCVPFIGLAEAHALAAIRNAGVPLQRIRPALVQLSEELGIEHVLASRSLYTDGFAADGWAERIHLPKYGRADVIADPQRSFGLPIFARGGVRLETVLAAFKAGTDIEGLISEYGAPRDDLLSVLRVHTQAA